MGRPPLAGDLECEVCVVGGGIGGIATAWHLLRHGLRAVVLEARTVASGASGRNGGFFIAGVAPGYSESCRLWGPELAARRHQATLDGQAAMLAAAEEIGAGRHFRLTGILRLAVDDEEARTLREDAAALAGAGFAGSLVEEAQLPAALRRPGRLGLFTAHDGSVHPARWVRALAAAAAARGVRVFEGTRVLRPPEPVAGRLALATAQGRVRAATVVVAADGGLGSLIPAAARTVRPRRLNMLATEPVARRVLPYPVYARGGHEYANQLRDGRLTLGGFSDLDGAASWTDREEISQPVQERLAEYLVLELGVDARISHRWAGVVGYAEDPAPTCGVVPGSEGRLLALGGYNGTGHVQAFVAGRIAAELVATRKSPDADLYQPVAAAV